MSDAAPPVDAPTKSSSDPSSLSTTTAATTTPSPSLLGRLDQVVLDRARSDSAASSHSSGGSRNSGDGGHAAAARAAGRASPGSSPTHPRFDMVAARTPKELRLARQKKGASPRRRSPRWSPRPSPHLQRRSPPHKARKPPSPLRGGGLSRQSSAPPASPMVLPQLFRNYSSQPKSARSMSTGSSSSGGGPSPLVTSSSAGDTLGSFKLPSPANDGASAASMPSTSLRGPRASAASPAQTPLRVSPSRERQLATLERLEEHAKPALNEGRTASSIMNGSASVPKRGSRSVTTSPAVQPQARRHEGVVPDFSLGDEPPPIRPLRSPSPGEEEERVADWRLPESDSSNFHNLHKHKLDKLTVCSLPTEHLREQLMIALQFGSRPTLVRLALALQELQGDEPWLTVLGETFWRKVFGYLDFVDVYTTAALVCSTFNHLVASGDCFQTVSMSGLEMRISDHHMYNVCVMFETVQVLDLSGCYQLGNVALHHVATHMPYLKELNLSGCPRVGAKGLAAVAAQCRGLEYVGLAGCTRVSDEAVSQLGRLEHLRVIELDSCPVTDNGLHELKLPTLRSISLMLCNEITDLGLRYLASNCPSLEHLRLDRCDEITDYGLQYVATAGRSLQTVGLERGELSHITDHGIKALAKGCPNLQYLDLTRCHNLTDAALRALSKHCVHLENLFLEGCRKFTDSGMRNVAKACRALQSLSLADCTQVGDSTAKRLADNCRSLQYVDFHQCTGVSDAGLHALSKRCNALAELFCRGCDRITDETMRRLAKYSPLALNTCHFSYCHRITDQGLARLASACVNLVDLRIEGLDRVTDQSLMEIASACKLLETLHVGSGNVITDSGMRTIAVNCTNLVEICIKEANLLTDDSLQAFGENLGALETLGIESCSGFTIDGICHLNKCPNLQAFYVARCVQLNDLMSVQNALPRTRLFEGYYDGPARSWVAEEEDSDISSDESE